MFKVLELPVRFCRIFSSFGTIGSDLFECFNIWVSYFQKASYFTKVLCPINLISYFLNVSPSLLSISHGIHRGGGYGRRAGRERNRFSRRLLAGARHGTCTRIIFMDGACLMYVLQPECLVVMFLWLSKTVDHLAPHLMIVQTSSKRLY